MASLFRHVTIGTSLVVLLHEETTNIQVEIVYATFAGITLGYSNSVIAS